MGGGEKVGTLAQEGGRDKSDRRREGGLMLLRVRKPDYEKFQIKKFGTIQKLVQKGYNIADRTRQYDIIFKL